MNIDLNAGPIKLRSTSFATCSMSLLERFAKG